MVKPGYKQTEVGVIPEDWEVLRLSDNFRIYAGGDVPKHSLSMTRSEKYPYPIYANSLQDKGLYGFTGERRSKSDSLTITGRGYLGHAEYRDEEYFPIVRLLVLEPLNDLDARFTTYAVNERVSFAFESTGVPQLTAPQVARYSIAAPSLSEQKSIASALTDADELIESLEQLLTKKRQIKQGAMQELLTGKKRLPEFSEEWEVKRLGDIISRFSTGLNPRQNFLLNSGGNLFYVTIKNFEAGKLFLDDECDRIDEEAFLRINERSDLQMDDILFSSIGRVGDAYLIKETPHNWNINESVFTLRPDKAQVTPLMLFYILTGKAVHDALGQGVTGSTFKSIKQAQLKQISCRLPSSLSEQTAIAEVLSDMDAEIEALEAKLTKARQVKQGMMQELLTGRIRLV